MKGFQLATDAVEILSLILLLLDLAVSSVIAVVALRFTAKPRVRFSYIGWQNDFGLDTSAFQWLQITPGSPVVLRFEVRLRGYFYGTPALFDSLIFFNFASPWEPIEVRHGSWLQDVTTKVRLGKYGRKYFLIEGLAVTKHGPTEEVQIRVTAPGQTGVYLVDIEGFTRDFFNCGHATIHIPVAAGAI